MTTPLVATPEDQGAARPRGPGGRAALWGAAALVLALALARAGPVTRAQLFSPFDLVYETPALRTIELLRAGENPYAPTVYATGRMWLALYPPLYAAVVAPVQGLTAHPYLAGRVVSLLAALVVLVSLLAVPGRRLAVVLLLAGALLLVRPALTNASLLKGDWLGIACSVLAVQAAVRARARWRWLLASAGLCVAAFAVKQVFLSAAVASAAYLLLNDRRRGGAFLLVFGGGVAAWLVAAGLLWGPGFWFCVFVAPQNPPQWALFGELWGQMLRQPVGGLLLALGLAAVARGLWRERLRLFAATPYPLYTLCAAGVLMVTLPKAGAATNYFIEWLVAAALGLAWELGEGRTACASARGPVVVAALLASAAVAEVRLARPADYSYADRATVAATVAGQTEMAAAVRRWVGDHPRLLNLCHASLSPPLPGEICISDPLLYVLLWEARKLDPAPVVAAVNAGDYDAIIVAPDIFQPAFHLPAALKEAVVARYQPVARFGDAAFLVRRAAAAAPAPGAAPPP